MADGSIKYKQSEDLFIKLRQKLWARKAVMDGPIGIIISTVHIF